MNSNPHPLVSVIAPFHNSRDYLVDFLKNWQDIRVNSRYEIQLILVDDHSTDDYLAYLSKAELSTALFIENEMEPGAGPARNAGLKKATGEYVYFVDVDDFVNRETFLDLLNSVQNELSEKIDIYSFGFTSIDYETKSTIYVSENKFSGIFKREASDKLIAMLFENGQPYNVWNKLYRRSFLTQGNFTFPNAKVAQDALFNLDVLTKVETVKILDVHIYQYLVGRPESNTNKKNSKFSDEKKLVFMLEQIFPLDSYGIVAAEATRIAMKEIRYLMSSGNFESQSFELYKFSNHFTFKGLQGAKVKMLLKNKLVRRIYSFLVQRKALNK